MSCEVRGTPHLRLRAGFIAPVKGSPRFRRSRRVTVAGWRLTVRRHIERSATSSSLCAISASFAPQNGPSSGRRNRVHLLGRTSSRLSGYRRRILRHIFRSDTAPVTVVWCYATVTSPQLPWRFRGKLRCEPAERAERCSQRQRTDHRSSSEEPGPLTRLQSHRAEDSTAGARCLSTLHVPGTASAITPSSKPQDVMKAVVRPAQKTLPCQCTPGQPGRDRLTELSAVFQS